MSFAAFLSSSVVGGLVAGFVALRNSERKIQIENVTQERAKWRGKVREKSNGVHKAAMENDAQKLYELRNDLALNLNPFDSEDNCILQAIEDLREADEKEVKLQEFVDRVSLLLKHDWERAKHEAKPWFFRWIAPSRKTYAEFKG